jgi:hypothetical protein
LASSPRWRVPPSFCGFCGDPKIKDFGDWTMDRRP